jgi:hypothetical protein
MVGHTIFFSDRGHRALYAVTDAHGYATKVMPTIYGLARAFGWEDSEEAKLDLDGCLELVRAARDLFGMEDEIYDRTGRRADAEGPQGNVSRVVRMSLRNFVTVVERSDKFFELFNVPASVRALQVAAALTTLPVENFFPLMRRHWAVPYMQQYTCERSTAVLERTKETITTAFNYTTSAGTQHHYMANACKPASATVFKVPKPLKRKWEGTLEEQEEEKEQRVESINTIILTTSTLPICCALFQC